MRRKNMEIYFWDDPRKKNKVYLIYHKFKSLIIKILRKLWQSSEELENSQITEIFY